MKLHNIRLLVQDFDQCFRFYSEKVGLKVTWGKPGGDYASFDIGIESNEMGFSLFKSDLMANAIGNSEKHLPHDCREKTVIVIHVDNVDKAYKKLSDNGVLFINKPIDMAGWGSRVAHFRDPEDNLIEIFSELPKNEWSNDLLEEATEYEK
jgi:catechol 2,3-dioxygenase-like lactoylglutathione lyase family enzyme